MVVQLMVSYNILQVLIPWLLSHIHGVSVDTFFLGDSTLTF